MKTPKISYLLLTLLSLMIFSSLTLADSITLASGSSSTANYLLTGTNASAQATFSFDGTTIRVEFRNTSTNDFRLGAISFGAQQYFPGQDNINGTVTLSNGQSWIAGGDEVLGPVTIRYSPLAVTGGIGYLPSNTNKLLAPGESGVALLTFVPAKFGGNVPLPPFQSVTLSFTNASFINPNGQSIPTGQILVQTAAGSFNNGGTGAEVPEPATMILLGSGLAALGVRARRRKQ